MATIVEAVTPAAQVAACRWRTVSQNVGLTPGCGAGHVYMGFRFVCVERTPGHLSDKWPVRSVWAADEDGPSSSTPGGELQPWWQNKKQTIVGVFYDAASVSGPYIVVSAAAWAVGNPSQAYFTSNVL